MSAPVLSRSDRRRIAVLVQALIDVLDSADGDCDLEVDNDDRCEAGDDGCGVFDHWHFGKLWGTAA